MIDTLNLKLQSQDLITNNNVHTQNSFIFVGGNPLPLGGGSLRNSNKSDG